MAELICKEEVYAVIGAAMEVYNELGSGFLEPVYQEAMEIELDMRRIPFEAQEEVRVLYKGQLMDKLYKADLIVLGKIIVELKALERLTTREEAQLLNYLKGTGLEVGILINFGAHGNLEWKRMILTKRGAIHE
jgi:GxxExxY protein